MGVGTSTPQKKLDVSDTRADILLKTTRGEALSNEVLSSLLFYNSDQSTSGTGRRIGAAIRLTAVDAFGRSRLEFGSGTSNPISTYGESPDYSDDTYTRMVIEQDGDVGRNH